jgi:hypothetical protein
MGQDMKWNPLQTVLQSLENDFEPIAIASLNVTVGPETACCDHSRSLAVLVCRYASLKLMPIT